MKGQYKTLSEIIDLSNKSRRTVYNHVNKLKEEAGTEINKYLIVIDEVQYLTLEGQLYIFESLGDTRQANKIRKLIDHEEVEEPKKEASTITKDNDESTEGNYTAEYIKSLKTQIRAYEKQIQDQNKQIDRLLEIVDTQSKQIALDTVNESKKQKEIIEIETKDDKAQREKESFLDKIRNLFRWSLQGLFSLYKKRRD